MIAAFQHFRPQTPVITLGRPIGERTFAVLIRRLVLNASTPVKVHTAISLLVLRLAGTAEHHLFGDSVDVRTEDAFVDELERWVRDIIVDVVNESNAL